MTLAKISTTSWRDPLCILRVCSVPFPSSPPCLPLNCATRADASFAAMDGLSQPIFTQALPADESQQSAPSQPVTQPGPVASTSTAPVAAPEPAVLIRAEPAAPPPPPINPSSAPQQPGQSAFHPFPEQDPAALPLTGFASIPARAAVLPNAQGYTRPTPYEAPNVELGAGLSREAPMRRFVNDAEIEASRTNGQGDLARQPGVVHEEKIQSLTVDQLRKMGVGRLPSGASQVPPGLQIRESRLTGAESLQASATRHA